MLAPNSIELPAVTRETARFAYVGTYTNDAPGGWSEAAQDEPPVGLTAYFAEPDTGILIPIQTVASDNPSWVTMDHSQNFLYVANEIQDAGEVRKGTIEGYSINGNSGTLSFINRVTTEATPAQICTSPTGDFLAVATYNGQTFELLPIGADGSLGKAISVAVQNGSGPHSRQSCPHPHAVVFDPSGRYLLTADLGTDMVKVFYFSDGILNEINFARMAPGSGPRHLSFHPEGDAVYVINELTNDIAAFHFDTKSGTLSEQIQLISTVPSDYPAQGDTPYTGTAEIMVHPSGRLLFASNRKLEDSNLDDDSVAGNIAADSIVTYSINNNRTLRLIGFTTHSEIRTPRAFQIDPTGKWLYALGQKSDAIVQFHINLQTGKLTPTGNFTRTKVPVSMAFK